MVSEGDMRWNNLLAKDKEYFIAYQQRSFEDLETQYITHFQRLVNGHCVCKPKVKNK